MYKLEKIQLKKNTNSENKWLVYYSKIYNGIFNNLHNSVITYPSCSGEVRGFKLDVDEYL